MGTAPFLVRFQNILVSKSVGSLAVVKGDFFFSIYALQPSRLIVRSELDVPTFATRRLHACHHARAPSGGRWELWARNVREFCLNADFHVTFRDIIHAAKLRHGTDGLTSPSDGFGRVRTRELWYQMPARYLYTTEALDHRSR